jgi:Sulfotransferase family
MSATLHSIENRSRDVPARRAMLANFELTTGVSISSNMILKEQGWSLYCLDQATKQAVFVKTPADCDLSALPFLRMAQYQCATHVALIAWDDLEGLSTQVPLPQNMILIFNMGRSGTTLVSRMLANVPHVMSLSEPNAQLDITMNRAENGQALTRSLIAACTRLQCRPPYGSVSASVAFKLYSQALFNCADYFANFPNAKYVFLYRDALSWGNSLQKMVMGFGFTELFTEDMKNFSWQMGSAANDPKILDHYFDQNAKSFFGELVHAPVWALHMEEYTKHFEAGVPFLAMRYNEIVADHEAATKTLLKHCGLAANSVHDALHGFDEDSQKGSGIGQDNKAEGFKPENYQRFAETLAKHPRFNRPDMILPDIYTPT